MPFVRSAYILQLDSRLCTRGYINHPIERCRIGVGTVLALNQCDTGYSGSTCTGGPSVDNGQYFNALDAYNVSGPSGISQSGPNSVGFYRTASKSNMSRSLHALLLAMLREQQHSELLRRTHPTG